MNFLSFFFFLLLSCSWRSNAQLVFDDIETVIKFLRFSHGAVDTFLDFYDGSGDMDTKEKRLLTNMNKISSLLSRAETNIPLVTIAKFDQMQNNFPQIFKFEFKLDQLVGDVDRVENSYREFLSLKAKLENKVNNSTDSKAKSLKKVMEDYATSVTTMQGNSIRSCLSDIHYKIDVEENAEIYQKSDVFSLILDNFNSSTDSRCKIDKSPQQLIFDTLTSLRLTQLKGLALFEFAYFVHHLYDGGDYSDFMTDFRNDMLKRFSKQAEIAMKVIKQADNSYWRCDPTEHVPEKTYTQITRLLQGYVHNEKELSHKDSCIQGCGAYTVETNPKCRHAEDRLCRSQSTCTGRVLNCKFVETDMHICFASPGSIRRYDWIRWGGSGPSYGPTDQTCDSGSSYFDKYRQYGVMWRCMYCFCFCDEDTDSDRYFSLEEMTSDIEQNKVVVGVRFAKQNRTVHLAIKQAKLLPLGIIDNTSMSWVDLPRISVHSWLDRSKYHKLSFESRAFDLDDLVAPKGFIVTGVRMREIGSHLNVEIRLTAFDFMSGKLFKNLTLWKGNDNTDVSDGLRRKEHDLSKNKRVPVASTEASNVLRSSPDSRPNTFIQFQPSDEYTDAAQSTVPFIDIQAVTPNPPIPLVGLGIIHKGAMASGGFIEPKVYTLSLADYSLTKVDNKAGNDEVGHTFAEAA